MFVGPNNDQETLSWGIECLSDTAVQGAAHALTLHDRPQPAIMSSCEAQDLAPQQSIELNLAAARTWRGGFNKPVERQRVHPGTGISTPSRSPSSDQRIDCLVSALNQGGLELLRQRISKDDIACADVLPLHPNDGKQIHGFYTDCEAYFEHTYGYVCDTSYRYARVASRQPPVSVNQPSSPIVLIRISQATREELAQAVNYCHYSDHDKANQAYTVCNALAQRPSRLRRSTVLKRRNFPVQGMSPQTA